MPITSSGMYWDDRVPSGGRPVLLLEGYTGQLIGRRREFCDLFIAKGLPVLRMDNRDIGLSRRAPDGTTYTIADMAQDVRDVIDDAGVPGLTVVGRSMGGTIAQQFAPRRGGPWTASNILIREAVAASVPRFRIGTRTKRTSDEVWTVAPWPLNTKSVQAFVRRSLRYR